MPNSHDFLMFLVAAGVLAIMPGPGLLYLSARTLAGGCGMGMRSCMGAVLGGLVHVAGGAIGLSAVLMASATAFGVLKLLGGVYLLWLAWQTWRQAATPAVHGAAASCRHPVLQGFVVEATNPKTALFFLAFIPQFVDVAAGQVGRQFAFLGGVAVALNSLAAIVVIVATAYLRGRVAARGGLVPRMQKGSALLLAALGIGTLVVRRPQG